MEDDECCWNCEYYKNAECQHTAKICFSFTYWTYTFYQSKKDVVLENELFEI